MAKKTKSERLLSLAKRLSEEGDKENSLFLKELANDESADTSGEGGLNDNEMSLLQHKLRSAIKPEAGEESEDE